MLTLSPRTGNQVVLSSKKKNSFVERVNVDMLVICIGMRRKGVSDNFVFGLLSGGGVDGYHAGSEVPESSKLGSCSPKLVLVYIVQYDAQAFATRFRSEG